MTTPLFLLTADDDERADLAALGVAPPADASAAARDAYVSELLRLLGECEANRARYFTALSFELERIHARYEPHIAALDQRATLLRTAIHEEALAADFGKKKSREVGYGTYGRRTIPESVKIEKPALLFQWVTQFAPHLVRERTVRDVPHDGVEQYVHETGDVPPGVALLPAYEKPECEPIEVTP